jgi:2-C-methyl-D-erythritol 4-phosphate cytidylyltransferase
VNVWTIVVAAGRGERFGAAKQFAKLGGATVLDRSVATARRVSQGVVVVLPDTDDLGWQPPSDAVQCVRGGATRSASVRAGLAAVPPDAEVVVVHDAARPLASPSLFVAVVGEIARGADAAVPAIAISDTIKRVDGSTVVESVPRDGLVTVQTPQAFRADALRAAHASEGHDTDDAALVEAAGGTVVIVPGEARNLKITGPADLEIAAALLEAP